MKEHNGRHGEGIGISGMYTMARQWQRMVILMGVVATVLSCSSPDQHAETRADLQAMLHNIGAAYAPDHRTAIWSVEVQSNGHQHFLQGKTDVREAYEALLDSLKKIETTVENRVHLLPSADLDWSHFALVNVSVSNLRSAPTHRAELVTQALLGTPLRILEHEDGWLRVQTPDRYIAWTEQQVLEEMTAFEIEQYLDSSVMIVKAHTYAYDQPKPEAAIVSDLVAGCILMAGDGKNGYLPVQYPDGRRGYIVQEYAKPLDQQPATTSFEQAAMQFYGTPYLWGGTSAKGMDCSGFTKNIYMLNGLMLPRDASQQVHEGELVDDSGNFSELKIGDLLFFGRQGTDSIPAKVVHVGMWLGNNRFIHASADIHISSVDPADSLYDAFNLNRYLYTRRIAADTNANHRLNYTQRIRDFALVH